MQVRHGFDALRGSSLTDTKQIRVKTTYEKRPSFFNFFTVPAVDDDEDMDEEEFDAQQQEIEVMCIREERKTGGV